MEFLNYRTTKNSIRMVGNLTTNPLNLIQSFSGGLSPISHNGRIRLVSEAFSSRAKTS